MSLQRIFEALRKADDDIVAHEGVGIGYYTDPATGDLLQAIIKNPAEAAKKLEFPRPIPCSERMPEHKQLTLFFYLGDWESGIFYNSSGAIGFEFGEEGEFVSVEKVSHWMPVPPKPEMK